MPASPTRAKGDYTGMQSCEKGPSLRERAAALFHKKESGSAVPGRRRKKWGIVAAVAVVLAAAVILPRLGGANAAANAVSPLDVTTLAPTQLQRTVSTTGTVESAKSVLVYSTQSYAVQEILVEVGDYVEEGQLMAKLDDGVILDQIESQEAAQAAASSASSAAIAAAEHNYQQYKEALDAGLNSSILNAESSVSTAYDNYVTAYNTYERFRADLASGTNSAIRNAQSALDAAEDAYTSAQKTYDRYAESLDEGDNATIMNQEQALRTAERSLEAAEEAYDSAQDAYDAARERAEEAQTSHDEAQTKVNTAQQTLQTAESEVARLEALVAADPENADLQAQLDAAKAQESQARTDLSQAESEETQTALTLAVLQTARDSAKSQVTTAERTLDEAEEAYDTAKTQYRSALDSADDTLEDYADAVDTAYESYLDAQVSLESAQADAQETLADYADRLDAAYEAYESAQAGLASTETAAQNQLQSYKDNLNSAYANADTGTSDVSLRQLRADLEGTEITAPAAGTVTAVYAEVGSSGAGLLFVIEDVENLVVATSVKDYDVASISTGMAVDIQSDSTGDSVYDGEVTSIAPTATKNAAGATDTTGDISFATDVAVTSEDTGLRIGMSVELDFVLEEDPDALAVPYDAVYENSQGQTCLLVLEEGEDGALLLTEMPVETGLETDLDIAVTGEGIGEGTSVVTDPERYLPLLGREVVLETAGEAG